MIKKLRWKFVAITMTVITAMLVLICGFILVSTRSSLQADSMNALEKALTLSVDTRPELPATDDSTLPVVQSYTEKIQIPYCTVQVVSDGNAYLLANQFFDTSDEDALTDIINSALAGEAKSGVLQTEDYSLRYLRSNTIFGERIAFVDLSQEQSTMSSLIRTLILAGLSAFCLFFIISILLANWAIRPVEKSWKQQRQFVADASHELKTPLAVILSSTDMLERCPDAEEEKQQRWLENVRVSSVQMKTLVEEMLVLARSDNATQKINLTDCDLSELVSDSLLLFEPLAFEKGKLMEDDLAENQTILGDSALLKRLIDIYLDNACKYGRDGSTIKVELKPSGKHTVLSVFSAGDPIPKDKLTSIFERFVRMDEARSTEGYGLGLSIATEIAHMHHGKVWAESSDEGNTFYFSMPRK